MPLLVRSARSSCLAIDNLSAVQMDVSLRKQLELLKLERLVGEWALLLLRQHYLRNGELVCRWVRDEWVGGKVRVSPAAEQQA